jgi:nucleotide-binding universal stress UspA family protein
VLVIDLLISLLGVAITTRLWTDKRTRRGHLIDIPPKLVETRRGDTHGVKVKCVRGMGDTPRVLSDVARSERTDLMVVGRSAKMLYRLVGSVSRRLVLNHESPVIVVVP